MPLNDTPPRLKAPPGTTDTHMHIYDSRYPTAGTAAFTPPDALVPAYLKVRARPPRSEEHTSELQSH